MAVEPRDFVSADALAGELERDLEPGERVLWAGRPDPGRAAIRGVMVAAVGAVTLVFVLLVTFNWGLWGGAWQVSSTGGAVLFTALFVLVPLARGLRMLLRPVLLVREARRTLYALTDRRALVVTVGRERRAVSYGAADLGTVRCVEHPDGRGDLLFGDRADVDPDLGVRSAPVGFFGIPGVRGVERLLRDTLNPPSG